MVGLLVGYFVGYFVGYLVGLGRVAHAQQIPPFLYDAQGFEPPLGLQLFLLSPHAAVHVCPRRAHQSLQEPLPSKYVPPRRVRSPVRAAGASAVLLMKLSAWASETVANFSCPGSQRANTESLPEFESSADGPPAGLELDPPVMVQNLRPDRPPPGRYGLAIWCLVTQRHAYFPVSLEL